MGEIPEDAEEALRSPSPQRPRAPEPERPWERWLKRLGWSLAGVICAMVLAMQMRPRAEPQITAPVRELTIMEEKPISATQTLRVVVMPSALEVFATRCLLYTNNETGHAALACAGRDDLGADN